VMLDTTPYVERRGGGGGGGGEDKNLYTSRNENTQEFINITTTQIKYETQ